MAGNNAIQILRGTSANIVAANSSTTLLAGQPLYNTDKNYLTIGAADGDALTRKPIAARELVGYLSDTDDNVAGTSTLEMYRISGNSQGAMNITAQGIINMTGQACNIISSGGSILLSAGTAGTIQANLSNGMSISSSYNVNISSSNVFLHTGGRISLTSTGAGITEYANTGPINITCAAPGASGGINLNGVGCGVNINALDMSITIANAAKFIFDSPVDSYATFQVQAGSNRVQMISNGSFIKDGLYTATLPTKTGTIALTTDIPQTKYLHKLHVEHSYTYSNIYYTFDFNLDIVNNSATKINSAIGLRDALLEFVPEGDNSVHYPVFGMYTARYNGTATYQRDEICWLDSVNFYYYDDRFRFTVCGGINFNGHSTTNVIQDYEHQTQNSDLITSIGGSGSYITISDTVFSI